MDARWRVTRCRQDVCHLSFRHHWTLEANRYLCIMDVAGQRRCPSGTSTAWVPLHFTHAHLTLQRWRCLDRRADDIPVSTAAGPGTQARWATPVGRLTSWRMPTAHHYQRLADSLDLLMFSVKRLQAAMNAGKRPRQGPLLGPQP
jgi:hypothetical protein